MNVKLRLTNSQLIQCLLAMLMLFSMPSFAQKETSVTYVRPGVDFAKYTEFLVTPLDMSDLKLVPPPWVEDTKPGKWNLNDADIALINSLYQENIAKGIHNKGKFNSVIVPTVQAIQVDMKITRLTPWAAKGESVETQGSGELKFEAELRDALTGDLLVLLEGLQQVGKNYQANTRLNHEHNLKAHFERWGEALSDALAKQHK